ncbi:hypothetical protein TBLA_0B06490 [Henningerozyma blattae CBS 6284]|uniref:Ribosomal protein L1 n=1 Tax=Henningerozyma blattae (strain ATCC 34711 / CBS 6284 / DSM 70876 / NBRC 10599 / NRRL Y-10934 / UCD 77-7) TaxID=1071380 RepID=I2GZC0_HENB6|nr:hypothetical protein TBLA_0B06490 [Tetrapisispora blattae CBS 6284]CCH59472.1 hypothetical protein TBLA_0B06490 [Tetrapisispora blattae CBS 6284]
MSSPLNLSKDTNTAKALDSLLYHCQNDKALENDKFINLNINTFKIIRHRSNNIKFEYNNIPRIIPLTSCKLQDYKELEILLILNDPIATNKNLILSDNSTSDIFKDIVSLKRFRRYVSGSHKYLKNYDIIMTDYRLHHTVVDILKKSSRKSSSSILPYLIRLSKNAKSESLKVNETVDLKYLKAQVKNICKNTSFVTNSHNCLSIKIGVIHSTSREEILSNIDDIVKFLSVKPKKARGTNQTINPNAGIIPLTNINSICLKTANSISLPIYKNLKTPETEKEDFSDIKL